MVAGGELPNGGKVSNKDLYEVILQQNSERERLRAEINDHMVDIKVCISRQDERIKRNYQEIDKLRERSTITDIALAIGAAIGTAVSAIIGSRH